MNKRRERLSPVIEAERRKSGVLERRASSLEGECQQLGRDLIIARSSIAKSVETIRALQVRIARFQLIERDLEAARDNWRTEALRNRDRAIAMEMMPLWRIAYQRLAARFRSAS